MTALLFSLLLLVAGPVDGTPFQVSGNPPSVPTPRDNPHSIHSDSLPYDLQNPVLAINFPSKDLLEISALGPTDEPGIFCALADERGEIFFIDCNNGGAITRRVLFRDKGDFEGVEKVGKCLYALKSNGDLFEIAKDRKSVV